MVAKKGTIGVTLFSLNRPITFLQVFIDDNHSAVALRNEICLGLSVNNGIIAADSSYCNG